MRTHKWSDIKKRKYASDPELIMWVRGTQSLIARFNGDYGIALDYVRDGLQHVDDFDPPARDRPEAVIAAHGLGAVGRRELAFERCRELSEAVVELHMDFGRDRLERRPARGIRIDRDQPGDAERSEIAEVTLTSRSAAHHERGRRQRRGVGQLNFRNTGFAAGPTRNPSTEPASSAFA